MDANRQALTVGLAAGLGGFAGLLLVCCVCWQIFCGSWCEKRQVATKVKSIPTKHQRHLTTASRAPNSVSAITPTTNSTVYSHSKANLSSDLASKVKSARSVNFQQYTHAY